MTYDIALKLRIVEEYEQTDCSYSDLSNKYNIKYSTIASWVQRYKKQNVQPVKIENNESKESNVVRNFFDVTQTVKEKERTLTISNKISLVINGLEIMVTKEGLMAILEVIKLC